MATTNESNRAIARRHALLTVLGIVIAVIGALVLASDVRGMNIKGEAVNASVEAGLSARTQWVRSNELPVLSSLLPVILR